VNIGWKTQHQFSRIGLLRRTIQFLTRFKIVIYCFFKSRTEFWNRLAVETNDIIDTRNMTNKAAIFVTILDSARIALMSHGIHCVTPACCRKLFASRT
jgi:hypothetical protein